MFSVYDGNGGMQMELLSPAGDFDSLIMAVQNGADAVYVGGNMFSARRNAVNFDEVGLARAADYCHLRSVKIYLAVNTLVKEFELEDLCRYLEKIYPLGIDAVIVQDMGVLRTLRRCMPEIAVNASTQMTVTTAQGVQELERLGVKRVVLSRELSAKEISQIRAQTKAELEIFVHGALCMSYSGQCLMSSMLGGRSGNRGACAQPCRLPYTLLENGREVSGHLPLLSPKDLCLVRRLPEVERCGADSLKIEGRMKSPEYVGMVTRVYREALDGNLQDEDVEKMLRFFSRGGSSYGYFDGKRFRSMMDYEQNAKISAGHKLEKQVKNTANGESRKRTVDMTFFAKVGEPVSLRAVCADAEISVSGGCAEQAIHRPMESERVRVQLEKMGGTVFEAKNIAVETDGKAAVSISEINGLRRAAVEQLAQKICDSYHRGLQKAELEPIQRRVTHEPMLCVEVQTEEQYRAAKKMGIAEIYVPYELYQGLGDEHAVCVLPELPRQGEKLSLENAKNVMVQHIGQLQQVKEKIVLGGQRLNVYNHVAAAQLAELGFTSLTASPELNLKELTLLSQNCSVPLEVLVYGRTALMLMENCVIKSAYRCGCKNADYALRDRKNVIFPLKTQNCRNVLYNSCPIYMADRMADIKKLKIDRMRLSFTVENFEMCCIIIKEYQKALSGQTVSTPDMEYTRGHFYRGVL